MFYGLRVLYLGLRVVDSIVRSLKLYYDNFIGVFMAKNNRNKNQNKHIDIKYLIIREHIKWSLNMVALNW